ncbi:hypothetical protein [Rhodoblastus sp.]|uniref:hypothetical protein n=1 Tax=Rhodoblastus sp. TaxID=1962975 RepID=UPI00260D0AAF|nr:hypothetical protein [Rhodoblastus sp.]
MQIVASGWQAMPGVEQFAASAPRMQITQPSVHSRQSGWRAPNAITAARAALAG